MRKLGAAIKLDLVLDPPLQRLMLGRAVAAKGNLLQLALLVLVLPPVRLDMGTEEGRVAPRGEEDGDGLGPPGEDAGLGLSAERSLLGPLVGPELCTPMSATVRAYLHVCVCV